MLAQFCRLKGPLGNIGIVILQNTLRTNVRKGRFPVIISSQFINSNRSFSSSNNHYALHKVLFVNAASPDNVSDSNQPGAGTDSLNIESINTQDYVPDIEYIPPPPVPPEVLDLASPEVLNALGEPTFSSLGLGGYTPSGLMQNVLETLHVSTGLPWWSTIAITTCIIRILVFPLVIKSQKQMAIMQESMPQIQLLNAKITDARRRGNHIEVAQLSQELQNLMSSKDYNPLKTFLLPLCQAPIFVSMFFALRTISNLPLESFKTGGMFWFTDLTVCDPYYLLPILTSVTMLITIEIGAEMGSAAHQTKIIRYVFRALPVVFFPFICKFPAAVLCYWVSTNAFSLIQVGTLRIPKVRNYFGIKKHVKHDPSKLPISKKGFSESIKESWSNMKVQGELRDRANVDQIRFKKAGIGPIVKTYKTNPTLGLGASVRSQSSQVINVKGKEKGR